MSYRRVLKNGIVIASTNPHAHAEQLGALQKIVFPTLHPDELMRPEHYFKHVELFPDGQFVALDGKKVVGMTSTIRTHFDFDHPNHTFADMLQGGWLTSHDPNGDWLYGMDMGVHPDYRGMGISRGLYNARQHTVRKYHLRGQLAGGIMVGYAKYKHKMTGQEYFNKVKRGEIFDPTISTQMKIGFEPCALLPNYISDPTYDGYGVLIRLEAHHEVHAETPAKPKNDYSAPV